jgi:LuxR family maltose regulon positive regulatory protein
VNQFRVRLKKPESDQWIIENMISINDLGNFQKEDKYLTLIRYQINKMRQIRSGDYYLVNRLLKNLLNSAEKSSRNGSVIEIKILLAQTHLLQGHIDKALHIFKQALALAEPEAYFRIFVDEGELIAELLKLAQEKNIFPEYAGHLLAVIDSGKPAVRNLPEALTEREFQVMLLLAKGLSNQEIADNLVISLSTTKTHITRIYGKLSVSSRTQAVIRARELKLL